MHIAKIGIDLDKTIFRVDGVTSDCKVAFNRSLRRSQILLYFVELDPCLIDMEAYGTSYCWAHKISALGHEVKLMPPIYVKPYVKRGRADAADAEAICGVSLWSR